MYKPTGMITEHSQFSLIPRLLLPRYSVTVWRQKMGRIEPGNEAKSITYTMTATFFVSVVREPNRMAAETIKKWHDMDGLIGILQIALRPMPGISPQKKSSFLQESTQTNKQCWDTRMNLFPDHIQIWLQSMIWGLEVRLASKHFVKNLGNRDYLILVNVLPFFYQSLLWVLIEENICH